MKFFLALIVFLFVVNASFAQEQKSISEAWEGFSDPEIMASGFTHDIKELPLEGNILNGQKAWSSTYWPSNKGSINNRWFSPQGETFGYTSPSREQVRKMSLEDLKILSPSEKYDLLMGNYDYPLKKEVYGIASSHAKDWEGICHGWSPAAVNHNEPQPKYIQNPDGVVIPFGSADIKGLLSYYYAYKHVSESTHQVGKRCFFGSWMGGAAGCGEDLNAGAFHIVMTNKLAIRKQGFVMDVDRFKQVWNQPVIGFTSKVVDDNLPVSRNAAKSAVYEMRIATELFYTDESDPTWDAVMGTPMQVVSKRDFVYRLEIGQDGKIVGGTWESKERPDFLWDVEKAPVFVGYLEKLSVLINDN